MTTLAPTEPTRHQGSWLSRSEAWLDARGKGAWIAAMVLGFIFFWPIGLALLFYMLWGKQMFGKSCSRRGSRSGRYMSPMTTTGNSAFDAYKADTLARLEREQHEFESFLERLRDAKDKAEFDQFMDERARNAKDEAETESTDVPPKSEA